MFYILRCISFYLLIINFILFFSQYRKENNAYKIYTLYLGVIVIIEILIRVVVVYGYQNLILSHFYFTGQFILLSFFYLQLLKEKHQKTFVKFNLIALPLLLGINFIINPQELHQFCPIEILVTSLAIILYSTFHFYNMLSHKKEFYLINCGILIYLLGSTVTFLPRNLHVNFSRGFSELLHFANIVLYIIYLIFILTEWLQIKLSHKNEKN